MPADRSDAACAVAERGGCRHQSFELCIGHRRRVVICPTAKAKFCPSG